MTAARRGRGVLVAAVAASLAASCRGDGPGQVAGDASSEASRGDASAGEVTVLLPRCRAPAGVSASPTSYTELLALINAMQRPLTMGCFLETLDRPLYGVGTTSVLSLQPASGARSPRIFLLLGPLTLAIVPDGSGRALLEFGQMVTETRSIKGEIAFPLWTEVSSAAPFQKVLDREPGQGTICRVCHADEQPHEAIADVQVFSSTAIRPTPRSRVDLQALRAERGACDSAVERDRCGFLGSLFDHGEVLSRDFPENLPTFSTF